MRQPARRVSANHSTPPPPLPARDGRPAPLDLPLRVRCGGLPFTLRPAAPAELWSWCAGDNWAALLPGLAPRPQQAALWVRLNTFADPLDLTDVAGAARRVGAALAGVDWWGAQRIAATCNANRFLWHAWQIRHAFDPDGASFARLLAAGYAFLVDGAPRSTDLDAALWAPPPATPDLPTPRWGAGEEAAAFAAALSSARTPRRA